MHSEVHLDFVQQIKRSNKDMLGSDESGDDSEDLGWGRDPTSSLGELSPDENVPQNMSMARYAGLVTSP